MRNRLRTNISSFEIGERYARTMQFREDLDRSWQEFNRHPIYFDWPTFANSDTGSFDSVRRYVECRK